MSAAREVERVARESYARLLALLAPRAGDLATAEDALSDALAAALEAWPARGVPERPEAWLLTAARRRAVDAHRRGATRAGAAGLVLELQRAQLEEQASSPFGAGLPDRRLALLLACAHPAVPADLHTPLMLQVVLGVDVARVAGALLTSPAALAQRLVRAKRKLGDLGWEEPGPDQLPARVGPVREAIYGAYGVGWEDPAEARGLAQEALWLAGLLARLRPGDPETLGLYGLLCACEARRGARRGPDGAFIPLEEQDPARWDAGLVDEAERAVWAAGRLGQPGPFQLEAAIQSVHLHRRHGGPTDWAAICGLYAGLLHLQPSGGAAVGFAAALGQAGRPAEGLALLDRLQAGGPVPAQAWAAVRSALLRALGRPEEARAEALRAAGLCGDPAVRAWLLARAAGGAGGPLSPAAAPPATPRGA